MALAVETPARDDLSFRTNDDKLVGARWLKSDGVTPVVIDRAQLAMEFDPLPPTYDPDTGEPIPTPPEWHFVYSETEAGDPGGWIDAGQLGTGIVLATIPADIWATVYARAGRWDVIAVGEGVQRCLVRGRFAAEEGLAT